MNPLCPFMMINESVLSGVRKMFDNERTYLEAIVNNDNFNSSAISSYNHLIAIPYNDFKPVISWLHENASGQFAILDWTGSIAKELGQIRYSSYWRVYLLNDQDHFAVKLLSSVSIDL